MPPPPVGSRYTLALYRGPAMVGFVPGDCASPIPVVEPRNARKFSMPADAIDAAGSAASAWAVVGLRPIAWDLARRAPVNKEDVIIDRQ